MNASSKSIFLPTEDNYFSGFDPIQTAETLIQDVQSKGTVNNLLKSIKGNRVSVESLLKKNNNLFSEKHMKHESHLKNLFLVCFNVCFYSFQFYNIFLMNGSPPLLDSLCEKALLLHRELCKYLESKKGANSSNINSEFLDDSLQILEIMKGDIQNIIVFNKKVQYKLNQYLELCEKQNAQAYAGKMPLYQKQKYLIFKINNLILKYFSLVIETLKLPENVQKQVTDIIMKNQSDLEPSSSKNQFFYLSYLDTIRDKSKFEERYQILKQQIEYLQNMIVESNTSKVQSLADKNVKSSFVSANKDPINSFLCPPTNSLESYISLAFHSHQTPNNRVNQLFFQEGNASQIDMNPIKNRV